MNETLTAGDETAAGGPSDSSEQSSDRTDRRSYGPSEPRPRLARPRDDRVIAGVASGIGHHLGIDPVVVRIGFVALSFFAGFGVLAYLLGWLLIPASDTSQAAAEGALRRIADAPQWVGVALIALAALVFLDNVGGFGFFWPLVLLAFGAWLLTRDPDVADPSEGGTPGDASADSGPSGSTTDASSTSTTQPMSSSTPPGGRARPTPSRSAPPPPPPRPRSVLGRVILALSLVAVGVVALLDTVGLLEPTFFHYTALVLTVIGAGLVVGGWWGRARGWIVIGVLLIPVLAVSSIADIHLDGGLGERFISPATIEQVSDEYRLFAGELHLDLTDLDLQAGDAVTVDAAVTFGQLIVEVPDDAAVTVNATTDGGQLDLLGETWQGNDLDVQMVGEGDPGAGELRLDLDTAFGQIEVRRR